MRTNPLLSLVWLMLPCVPMLFAAADVAAQVVTYPAPAGASLIDEFRVRVRAPGGAWQDVPTYRLKVDEVLDSGHVVRDTSAAWFDFAGQVEVEVIANHQDVASALVRPLSFGIAPSIEGRTLRFTLDRPRNLSVEPNGDRFRNLHLFANAIESDPPKPHDPNVIYFGPGCHSLPNGVLRVPSGKTVYLAGGSVVRGRIVCDGVENVRIRGRGMLEQGVGRDGIRIANSRQVEVSGIVTPKCFTGGSRHVTIRDVKCISYVGYGDGMNVICSTDVLIDGVFNRNSDDCITVYAKRGGFVGDARRITVQNSTLWADVAHPILVGTHGNTPQPEEISDLAFVNLDILDHKELQLDYQGCLALNAGDSNLIRDVRFEDIRIEDFRQGQLVNIRVFYNRKYCTSPGRGVENVLFKNITYSGSNAEQSIIAGYDETRKVKNVVFENLVINGQVISDTMKKPGWFKTSDMARFFIGEHTEGIVFRPAPPAPVNEDAITQPASDATPPAPAPALTPTSAR